MANIKEKDIHNLSDWNMKELRKLKIMLGNRITSFENSSNPKELQKSHILFDVSHDECKKLLENVYQAEKDLVKKL